MNPDPIRHHLQQNGYTTRPSGFFSWDGGIYQTTEILKNDTVLAYIWATNPTTIKLTKPTKTRIIGDIKTLTLELPDPQFHQKLNQYLATQS